MNDKVSAKWGRLQLDPVRFRNETVIPILMEMPSVQLITARRVLTISTAYFEIARRVQISVKAAVAEVRRVLPGPANAFQRSVPLEAICID